ncbi:hypothetical protein AB0J72_05635 [Dactylosporangium sp. NPDC049742]|uniref:hypothetical protein n=1 Tax=Dactylosporangium sp. NPDC049742 TaxID=3154737 RepID=UPI00341A9903
MTSPTAFIAPRPLRSAAVGLVVLSASVLVWYAVARRWHNAWHDDAAGFAAFFLPPLALVIGALIVVGVLKARPRPAAFEVTGGAFVAPAATQVAAASAALLLTLAHSSAILSLQQMPDDWWSPFPVRFHRVILACLVAGFLVKVAALARQSGRIELRPAGLRVRSLFADRDVSWEQLAAKSSTWPADEAWVRREFLTAAINHYLADPAARENIGTAEGYEHLRRALCG